MKRPHAQSRGCQRLQCRQAEQGAGRQRFERPRQTFIERRDGDVDVENVGLRYGLQQLQVSQDQVRFGGEEQPPAALAGKDLQQGAGASVARSAGW